MPFTFLRKQIFPPTPPRFVKFCERASSETHGASRTVPTSDHVPELMNAQSFPVAGIAAIAEAVSWQAGTITFVSCSADSSDKSPRRFPIVVPLATILGAAVRFRPTRVKNFSAPSMNSDRNQSRVCRVRIFRDGAATEPIRDVLRQIHPGSRFVLPCQLVGEQLIDCVDSQNLRAGQFV